MVSQNEMDEDVELKRHRGGCSALYASGKRGYCVEPFTV